MNTIDITSDSDEQIINEEIHDSSYTDRQKKYYNKNKNNIDFKLKKREQNRQYYLKKRQKMRENKEHKHLVFTGKICTFCGKPLRRRKNKDKDFQNRTMHVRCYQKYKTKLYNDLKAKFDEQCQAIKDLHLI
jgi:hypothetical protein